jgi:hypothetical protein
MLHRLRARVRHGALLFSAVSLVLGASALFTGGASAQDTRTRPPPTAPQPAQVFNALSALAQTALVVEGTVKEAISEFSEDTGPWTRFELTEVVVHFGEGKLERLALAQRGGNYPDGGMLVVSTSPEFVVGARYLVFLRNTSWNLTPVVGDYVFRLETEDGRQLLVGPTGGAVVDFDEDGVVLSEPLYAPADLNGSPPERLKEPLPARTLDVTQLSKGVQAFLDAKGLKIAGTYYDEPATRAKRLFVEDVPGKPPTESPGDDLPSDPETRPRN